MMDTTQAMETSDAELVAQSLSGDRDSFGRIVARYQTLICSMAYSRTGNLSESEDLAQETFVAAWKQLATLRDPEKLRSWLCGIARHRIIDSFKKSGREPSHYAESLDCASEVPSPALMPRELTMSHEEQAILWRSIGQIPETYRDPLILFYREHQSVETVARNLELTEEAAKQRLSRGRKMLQEQVAAFVETALARTSPGRGFTSAVLAALPAMTVSTKTAVLGALSVKGGATAKAAGVAGMWSSLLTLLLSLAGIWFSYRLGTETARSEAERKFVATFFKGLAACMAVFFILYMALMFAGSSLVKTRPELFVALVIGLSAAYIIAIAVLSLWTSKARRRFVAALTTEEKAARLTLPAWEYRSSWELLGLPLIHLSSGPVGGPVTAWIASGGCAIGVVAAFGGLAIAPISVGGCAIGLFSFGGLGIGALVLGGLGVGIWSFAGLAIGWQAFGGCAIGWQAAWGGFAVARDFALGALAHAAQFNNDTATQFANRTLFFRVSEKLLPYLFWLNLAWFAPLVLKTRLVMRQRRQQHSAS